MATYDSRVRAFEDAFVKVSFEEEDLGAKDPAYAPWFDHGSAKRVDSAGFGAILLHKLYPNRSVTPVLSPSVLAFPGAVVQPLSPDDLVSNIFFLPLGRHMGHSSGVLIDQIRFGAFKVAWDKHDFVLYVVRYPIGFGETTQQYIVHDGPEDAPRALVMAAGIWENDLHEEIYVFNQGFWQKDHSLWLDVQKADWKDVILKDEFKSNLKKDVYGFFDSEDLYKSLSIPWKRGIILHGPPGNGKTISMKAIIKECDAKGYTPLYVRSFQSWMGEEGAMAAVFGKARQMSPCVIILEDLDSLINDRNRSFFLNELDGFQGNDGLLVIGSTNHFDRLDPGLSGRPSRFDRKYLFDDPDLEERKLYVRYWQNKLKGNKEINFPDSLVDEVAAATNKFSFAYLKEAFLSSLVLLAGMEGDDKPSFADILKKQIKTLRQQLDQDPERISKVAPKRPQTLPGAFPEGPSSSSQSTSNGSRFPQSFGRSPNQTRFWDAGMRGDPSMNMFSSNEMHADGSAGQRLEGRRDVRSMALAAAAMGRSWIA